MRPAGQPRQLVEDRPRRYENRVDGGLSCLFC
jgi:hypothetical protein